MFAIGVNIQRVAAVIGLSPAITAVIEFFTSSSNEFFTSDGAKFYVRS